MVEKSPGFDELSSIIHWPISKNSTQSTLGVEESSWEGNFWREIIVLDETQRDLVNQNEANSQNHHRHPQRTWLAALPTRINHHHRHHFVAQLTVFHLEPQRGDLCRIIISSESRQSTDAFWWCNFLFNLSCIAVMDGLNELEIGYFDRLWLFPWSAATWKLSWKTSN